MKQVRLYLFSRFLSTIAYQMQSVAVAWQIYDIRKNPMDLGWAGLAQFLPMICFSLIGGQIADRYERKTLMRIFLFFWSLLSLVLFLACYLDRVSLTFFLGFLFLQGFLRAFSNPTTQAFITQLVSAEYLKKAVALNSSVWQVSNILGPVLGGLFYTWFERGSFVYLLCSVSLFCSWVLISILKAEKTQRITERLTVRNLFSGVEYVWGQKLILGAISLDLFAVLFGGAVALLPAFAADILHVGPQGLGVLRSAPGVGAILTSLYLAARPIQRRVGFWLFFNVILFGLATIGFGLSRNFWLSLFCLFVTGAADIVSVVIRMTLVQIETPSHMRGRVSAVNSIFISASNELGEFESGITAGWFGIVPSVVIGGVGTLLVAGVFAKLFPELRKMEHLGGKSST
jgi:MFS family permease